MENRLLSSFKKAIKYWWVSLLVGIISIVVGTWCMFTPFLTFAALSIVFVISFFIGGISEIIFAITNKDSMKNWRWTLAMGIIDLLFAIILINNMELAPIMFAYLVAFWIMLRAIWGVGMALDLQRVPDSGWGWLLVLSILGVIASTLLLFQPAIAGLFAAYIISFSFISYGVLRVYLAFKLKEIGKRVEEKK